MPSDITSMPPQLHFTVMPPQVHITDVALHTLETGSGNTEEGLGSKIKEYLLNFSSEFNISSLDIDRY